MKTYLNFEDTYDRRPCFFFIEYDEALKYGTQKLWRQWKDISNLKTDMTEGFAYILYVRKEGIMEALEEVSKLKIQMLGIRKSNKYRTKVNLLLHIICTKSSNRFYLFKVIYFVKKF